MEPKRIVEAALFISPRPLTIAELARIAATDEETIEKIIKELEEEFTEHRGIALERIGNAFRFYVPSDVFPLVKHLTPLPEFTEKEARVIGYIAQRDTVLRSELRKKFGKSADSVIEKLKSLGVIVTKKRGKTLEIKKTKLFNQYFITP